MGRILLGFVIGIAFSAVVLGLLDLPTEEAPLTGAPTADEDVRAVSAEDGGSAQRRPGRDQSSQSRIATAATPESATITPDDDAQSNAIALPEDEAAREARLRREIEEAQAIVRRASGELEQMAIARLLASNPVVSPSPLPPEFDWVDDLTYRGLFHDRFEREPIDGAWSAPMEAELLQFVYDQPGIVERYGPPTVRCHTRRCEVLFTTASGAGSEQTDVRALLDNSLELMPDTFDCGPSNCWADANQQNGIATIFWGMVVKRGDERPQSLVARATE